jgi:hypothetical protein
MDSRWSSLDTSSQHSPLLPFLALSYLLRLDAKYRLINQHARCGITIGSYSKVVKTKLPTNEHYQLVQIQACPPITTQLQPRQWPLLVLMPMLIMLQCNLHYSCILFKAKPIAAGLRINLYAAPTFLPCSKLSDAAS